MKFAVLAGALLASFITVTISTHSTLLNGWDDWRWRHLSSSGSGTHIYLVDIDEKSLSLLGRWPWPRERLASLTEQLLEKYLVTLVGVDIILSEPGDTAGNARLAALDKEKVVWAEAASLNNEPDIRQGVLAPAPRCPNNSPWEVPIRGWLGLTESIAGNYFRAGHIRPWPDADGKVRTYQPFLADGDTCVPALGLAMYAALLGLPTDAPLTHEQRGYHWGGIPLGVESSGTLRLIWRMDSLKSIPAHQILEGDVNLPAGAIAIVGSTALGIGDFVATPSDDRFTGAGIHALALRQWLDQDFVARPALHDAFLAAILTPLFLAFWFYSSTTVVKPWIIWAGAMALVVGSSSALWHRGVLIESEPLLWALLWLPGIQGLRLWQQHQQSRIIYQQFNAYLPEKVLQELIHSQIDPHKLAAESKEVSVLFADLRGFTSISENLTPDKVVELLNEVMEYLSNHIACCEGTLDKFMGDGIMAFWGAPIAMADHADRAINCAVAMLNDLEAFNTRLQAREMPTIDLTIGINSGQVAVGHMGSLTRKNYTAIGDVVNVASRLQQHCGELGQHLLIGEATATACTSRVPTRLQDVDLKGKRHKVTVFTIAQ